MSGYLQWLAEACKPLAPVETQVVLLTGQSSFRSSALSPVQLTFLKMVAPAGASILDVGFPFDDSFIREGFRETGMLTASWRNARQVYWSMYSPEFRDMVARRLQALMDASTRQLILITGSCGLQLANAAWPMLRKPEALRLDVVALGPVCFERTRMPATVLQGRWDMWSSRFYKGWVDHFPGCGHLGYWESPEVQQIVAGLLR